MSQPARLRSVRLPLPCGHSPIIETAVASVFSIAAISFGGDLLYLHTLESFWGWLGAGLVVLGGLGAWIGLTAVWPGRPGDVVIEEKGFRIEGGRQDGAEFRWDELDPERCRIENDPETPPEQEPEPVEGTPTLRGMQLFVSRRGEDERHMIAEAWQSDDRPPLRALFEILQARTGGTPPAEAELPSESPVAVLGCPECGASLAPRDEDEASCRYCGGSVPVPEELRERVRTALELDRSSAASAAMIAELLDQPGARSVTRRQLLCYPAMLAAMPVAAFVHATVAPTFWHGVLAWFLATFVVLFFTAIGAQPAHARLTLRRCLLQLGARRGARGELTCRSCGAPLPADENEAEPRLLVHCTYCASANLRGLERASSAPLEREADLEQMLEQRNYLLGSASSWMRGLAILFGLGALLFAFTIP